MRPPLDRAYIALAASAYAAIAIGGCRDVGAAPVGEMIVGVEPEHAGELALAGAESVALDGAWLAIETVEIGTASGEEEEGGGSGHDHGHGDEGASSDAETGPVVATAPAVVDLLGEAVEIHHEEHAPAASYEDVTLSFAPAGDGPVAGFSLLLTGDVDDGTGSRPFAVRWSEDADGLVTHHAELALAPGQRRQVRLVVHVDELLRDLALADATTDEGVLVFDGSSAAATAERLRANVAAAVQLEAADAHDEEHHGGDG